MIKRYAWEQVGVIEFLETIACRKNDWIVRFQFYYAAGLIDGVGFCTIGRVLGFK
ncbi:MAG TPA: hypothetical protein PLV25_05390 [Opitutales bacterium]|nr:hypothetical protein [Opitutales bacterium]